MAERQGAKVSTKTLALASIDGRLIDFKLSDDWAITGYLCGLDDFHYRVVEPSGRVHLIHKASTPVVSIYSQSTYVEEDQDPRVAAIISPFIAYMKRIYQKDSNA